LYNSNGDVPQVVVEVVDALEDKEGTLFEDAFENSGDFVVEDEVAGVFTAEFLRLQGNSNENEGFLTWVSSPEDTDFKLDSFRENVDE
jgi:hypothetical protein